MAVRPESWDPTRTLLLVVDRPSLKCLEAGWRALEADVAGMPPGWADAGSGSREACEWGAASMLGSKHRGARG